VGIGEMITKYRLEILKV